MISFLFSTGFELKSFPPGKDFQNEPFSPGERLRELF